MSRRPRRTFPRRRRKSLTSKSRGRLGVTRLLSEQLEDRRMLATYSWDATADTLAISLADGEELRLQQSGSDMTFRVFNGTFTQIGSDMATESPTSNPTFISIPAADLVSSVAIDNTTATGGQNLVNFQGTGSLTSTSITVDLSDTDAVGRVTFNNFDLTASTVISLKTTRDIFVGGGSDLTTAGSGTIDMQANLQATPTAEPFTGITVFGRVNGGTGGVSLKARGGASTSGSNYGVLVNGSTAEVTADGGPVLVEGTGGTSSSSNYGVYVSAGGNISNSGTASSDSVEVLGEGGNVSTGRESSNYGVYVALSGTQISSSGGTVRVEGSGGGYGTGGSNYGVYVTQSGVITSAGSADATVDVIGRGGNSSGTDGDNNYGVHVSSTGSRITSSDAAVTVDGTGGGSGASERNYGVYLTTSGIDSAGVNAPVNVVGRGGNSAVTSSGGSNYGVYISGTDVEITANGGALSVDGTGGGGGTGGNNFGVYVANRAAITNAGAGTVNVSGAGGNLTGSGSSNHGVYVSGTDAQITSTGGAVKVAGAGGGAMSSTNNVGVYILGSGAVITAGPGADVTVLGEGGNLLGAGARDNHGVLVTSNGKITADGGAVFVEGTGGGTNAELTSTSRNNGVYVASSGMITNDGTGSGAKVSVFGYAGTTNGTGTLNSGVYVSGTNALITSSGGDVYVWGEGGGASWSLQNHGVHVESRGVITAGGNGKVEVTGLGGNLAGQDDPNINSRVPKENYGVYVSGADSRITSGGGAITVDGIGGGFDSGGSNHGVFVSQSGVITNPGTAVGSNVKVIGKGGNSPIVDMSGAIVDQGTGGNNYGVYVQSNGSQITANGGEVDVDGTGGGSSDSNNNYGVYVQSGGTITNAGTDPTAKVDVEGEGGNGSNGNGVYVAFSGSQITSSGGTVEVTGTGGSTGNGYGVYLSSGGQITSDGTGVGATVTVIGQGGGSMATNGQSNYGVYVNGTDAQVTSSGGAVSVTGTGGGSGSGGGNYGVYVGSNGKITSAGTSSAVDVVGFGGATEGGSNDGVYLRGSTTQPAQITSSGGPVTVEGTGGGTVATSSNTGVNVSSGAQITSTGTSATSSVTVIGRGGSNEESTGTTTTGSNNYGVWVAGAGAQITANGGPVSVTGNGGNIGGGDSVVGTGSRNYGVYVDTTGQITNAGTGGNATVEVIGVGGTNMGSQGQNHGVYVYRAGSQITANDGAVSVAGTGGGGGNNGSNHGVFLDFGGVITNAGMSTYSTVDVSGTGGNTDGTRGFSNHGVFVEDAGSRITSSFGAVSVDGTGGGVGTGGSNYGVAIARAGAITSDGTGTTASVDIDGQGGNPTGASSGNYGVYVTDTDSLIDSSGGNITVDGTGGGGVSSSQNYGVYLKSSGRISSQGTAANLTVMGTGGEATGSSNYGVYVEGTTSGSTAQIASGEGQLLVEGTGGGTGNATFSHGVVVDRAGIIASTGSSAAAGVIVRGQGGSVSATTTSTSNNYGVFVSAAGSEITSTAGPVLVEGTGGGTGSSSANYGVYLSNSGVINSTGTDSTVEVIGQGGNSSGSYGASNHGVWLSGSGSSITSSGGNVDVEGTGGGVGNGPSNYGVYLSNSGVINSTGVSADVSVTGRGGNATGAGSQNRGIYVTSTGSQIASSGGEIFLNATGTSTSEAAWLQIDGAVSSGGNANITVTADSLRLDGSPTTINSGTGTTTIVPETAGTLINLGGSDVLTGSPLTLGLTDQELDTTTAGTINIGNATSGAITVSNFISRPAQADLNLISGGAINFSPGRLISANGDISLNPGAAGVGVATTSTDLDVGTGNLTFSSDANLNIAINGQSVNSQYHQLKVNGAVDLTGAGLELSGSYTPNVGQVFTIVDATSVTGEFDGLADNDTLFFNGRLLRINYSGATVTLTVIPSNLPPIANDDSGTGFTTGENLSFTTASVLANDSDSDFDILSVSSFDTSGTVGQVTDNGDGTFDYDPNGQFSYLEAGDTATDTFTYTISDGNGGSATATVTITITGFNELPTANDDSGIGFATDEDTAFTTGNVLTNDTDPDASDILTVSSFDSSGTQGGFVTYNGDGTFTYNPLNQFQSLPAGGSATDTFTYTITDGNGGFDTATVTIAIDGVNDPPSVVSPIADVEVDEDAADVPIPLSGVFADPDSTLSFTATSDDGTLVATSIAGSTLTLSFGENQSGTATVTVTASDGQFSAQDLFQVTVEAVADAPTLNIPTSAPVNSGEPAPLPIDASLTDPDEDLTIIICGVPEGVALSAGTDNQDEDNSWTVPVSELATLAVITPPNFEGEVNLFVKAISSTGGGPGGGGGGGGGGSTATTTLPVTITVIAVAAEPNLTVPTASLVGDEDTDIGMPIEVGLVDTDGSETLTVTISNVPAGVILSDGVNSSGDPTIDVTNWDLPNLVVTPVENSDEDISLTVTATSTEQSNNDTASTVVDAVVTVRAVADAPNLEVQAVSGTENSTLPLDITSSLVDTDGSESLSIQISNVPANATLSAGSNLGGGVWSLTSSQLAGLEITVLDDADADLLVVATSTEAANGDTAETTLDLALTVTNDAPEVDADDLLDATLPPNLMGVFSRTIDFTDDGTLDTHEVTVNFGDGSGDQTFSVGPAGTRSFTLSHTYTMEGTFDVTVAVEDNALDSDSGAFSVEVILNTPPVAEDVFVSATEDAPVTAAFDADDVDVDDTPANLTYDITSTPGLGTVENNDDGTFTFYPGTIFQDLAVGESEVVSFTYTATDLFGDVSNTATVTITINGVNDDPTAAGESFGTNEDTAFTTGNVLTNDTDIDTSDVLSVQSINVTSTLGLVTNNGDGTFGYDPNGQFESLAVGESATDSFTYTISDGNGGSDTATATITINGANDDVTITSLNSSNDSPAIKGSVGLPVTISGAFEDADVSDLHSVTIDWGETPGAADRETFSATDDLQSEIGTFTRDFVYSSGGIFTVTVTVTDGNGGSDTQTANVVIGGVGLVDGTLYVIGTDGEDKVDVKVKGGDTLNVKGEFDKRGAKDKFDVDITPVTDVVNIVIILCGDDDDAHVHNNVAIDALIDGGGGDDKLRGGGGSDTLLGGAGNDDLKAGTDGGTDGTPDILSEGDGDDKLKGGKGMDVLIGGVGEDDIKGGSTDGGGDLVVGGYTTHDHDPVALAAIRNLWVAGDVSGLTSGLLSSGNVFGDGVEDKLDGNKNSVDLFFAELIDDLNGDDDEDTIIWL